MKNKNNVDRPARTFARQVERIARSERVSIVSEMKKQARRVLRAVQKLDASLDTVARELARRD